MESATLFPPFAGEPYLLMVDSDVILIFVSGIPHQGYIPPKRHVLIIEVVLIFKYLRHRLIIAALGVVHWMLLHYFFLQTKKKMEHPKRFEEATATTANTSISINSIIMNRPHPIVHAKLSILSMGRQSCCHFGTLARNSFSYSSPNDKHMSWRMRIGKWLIPDLSTWILCIRVFANSHDPTC